MTNKLYIIHGNRRLDIKAVLFDIDGTILNCHGAGKNALIDAALDTLGTIGEMKRVDFQGKTDPVILRESLGIWGFGSQADRETIEKLKRQYFHYLGKYMYTHDTVLLPGIHELLERLNSRTDAITGLLTGNFTESAHIKLDRFGLGKYFKFGAYGDDAQHRNGLPPVAKKILLERFGLDIAFEDMIIIGDTVHDITCARASGAVSISVGTGWTGRESLLSENPDHFFDDLSDADNVMDAVMNGKKKG